MALRKWRFTSGISSIQSQVGGTDFWFLPSATSEGGRTYTVKDHWELTPAGEIEFAARRAFESRLDQYANATGRVGLLEIDFGEAFAKSYDGVRFNGVRPSQASNNAILILDLEFEFPIAGTIARSLQFGLDADGGKLSISAGNFVLNYDAEIRNIFKYPLRSAPVRIEGGPGLKILRITSIQQAVTNSTAIERRQALEALIKNLAWTYKGKSKPLKIDGAFLESSANFELQNITPSDLSLPDSLTYDLQFVTGYVE